MRHLSTRPPFVVVLVALIAALVAACGSSDDAAPVTTSSPAVDEGSTTSTATSSETTASSEAPTTSTTSEAAPPELTAAIYWVRPYGDPRAIDIPAYTDPPDATHAYVLFGSLTNSGAGPAPSPSVVATWRDSGGQVVATATGRVVDPFGADLTELAPGASADVVVVVDDPATAELAGASQPTLEGVVS